MVLVRDYSGEVHWQAGTADPAAMSAAPAAMMAPVDGGPNLRSVGYDWKVAPVGVPAAWEPILHKAAKAADVSPALLASLVWQESRWNARALSPKGARGLTQLMPETARELGCDPADPAANLYAGARYLRRQLDAFGGDVEMALAAYNAGAGRVRRAGGIPAIRETQNYVAAIVERSGAVKLASTLMTAAN
ncbi:lytic transglycosylase domain-containing protein [Sphingomonas ginkgonis]|uniref:Lytic transglycosylase domain-containing protein n=2 Tax=Sphingomonas ginkgonis TaxID=2315330 RepID=A0A429VDC2_9SPHN|nr:lytic transglycosylase domain-containing protein [Sphingomonas ginkgonis]